MGARIAVASENRPELVELMFAYLGRRTRLRAHQLQASSPRSGPDPRGLRRLVGVRVRQAGRGPRPPDRRGDRARWTRSSTRITSPGSRLWSRRGTPTPPRWPGCSTRAAPRVDRRARRSSQRNLMAMRSLTFPTSTLPTRTAPSIHARANVARLRVVRAAAVSRGRARWFRSRRRSNAPSSSTYAMHNPGSSAFLAPTMVQRLVDTGGSGPAQSARPSSTAAARCTSRA